MPFPDGWRDRLPQWFKDLQQQERDLDRLRDEQGFQQWINDEAIRIRAKLSAATGLGGKK